VGTPVSSQRFAVVDVETSGLSVRRHRLLQVGVVVIDGDGRVLDRWGSLVAPRRRWWYRVGPTRLHGIHRRDVVGAPPAEQVLGELAVRIDGAHVVAHNAEFDIAFLARAAAEAGIALDLSGPICTLRLSRALDPERRLSHRLGDMCARYDVQVSRPHDALSDADATAAVLPHLLRAHGIVTADQLPTAGQARLAS
jgi:DNA polymerase-3 subunit epsilon